MVVTEENTINNLEKTKCCTCGFEWYKGSDGSHSCSDNLLKKVKSLEVALQKLIDLAEQCDGWECFPSQALEDAQGAITEDD